MLTNNEGISIASVVFSKEERGAILSDLVSEDIRDSHA